MSKEEEIVIVVYPFRYQRAKMQECKSGHITANSFNSGNIHQTTFTLDKARKSQLEVL